MNKIYIVVNNHFDLTWRRAYNKPIVYNGMTYISYANLEAEYIIRNIEFAKKYDFYKFDIESVAVVKNFLRIYPEYEPELKKLYEQKRISTPFTGNNIIDTNLVNGESIVRNFIYGKKYMEDKFKHCSKYCDRDDAFGNSAQLPQILRKSGISAIYNISYTFCNEEYWRGLDGSIVKKVSVPKTLQVAGGYYKYAPCPKCNGEQDRRCSYCHGTGIDEPQMENFRSHFRNVDVPKDNKPYTFRVWGEEVLPHEIDIKWYIDNKDKNDIRYVTYEEMFDEIYGNQINVFDNISEEDIHPNAEINPNNTGCYVSRIDVKKKVRKCENDMFTAEYLLSCTPKTKREKWKMEVLDIWESLHFTMFHDSITGTVVDTAYDEVIEILDNTQKKIENLINTLIISSKIENNNKLTVANPLGFEVTTLVKGVVKSDKDISISLNGKKIPFVSYVNNNNEIFIEFIAENIPPFGSLVYDINSEKLAQIPSITNEVYGKNTILEVKGVLTNEFEASKTQESSVKGSVICENEFYRVLADRNGLLEIFDKKLNKNISQKSEFRPCELILENDIGSPWATVSTDMRRVSTANWTRMVGVEKCSEYEKIKFSVRPNDVAGYSIVCFNAEFSVTLYKGLSRIDEPFC